jgi:hypothetical protein
VKKLRAEELVFIGMVYFNQSIYYLKGNFEEGKHIEVSVKAAKGIVIVFFAAFFNCLLIVKKSLHETPISPLLLTPINIHVVHFKSK